jgi:GH24 family phage-related lysozyme (muramidase)
MTVDIRTPADIKRDADNERLVRTRVQPHLAAAGVYAGKVDGWGGKATVEAWNELFPPAKGDDSGQHPELPGFRGDLARVHGWESHAGKPYWPTGDSGVTLDPGFDLGHQTEATLRRHYLETNILTEAEVRALVPVLGIRGGAAKAAAKRPSVARIRISRAAATKAMPAIAAPYWRDVAKRFPALLDTDTPSAVHTVFLSLGYNRGPNNRELGPLAVQLAAKNWSALADAIGGMQQRHKTPGIPVRRREEADLIRQAIA